MQFWKNYKPKKLEFFFKTAIFFKSQFLQTYEILDQYMWLSMRFPDMLPDEPRVREASKQLDTMIQVSVLKILNHLFKKKWKKKLTKKF